MRYGTVWTSEYFWLNLDWHSWTFGFSWASSLRFSVIVYLGPFSLNFATKKRYKRGPNDPCGWCGEFHHEGFYHNDPTTAHLR